MLQILGTVEFLKRTNKKYIFFKSLIFEGVPTGKCIQSSLDSSVKVCEITAWCPVEHETNLY